MLNKECQVLLNGKSLFDAMDQCLMELHRVKTVMQCISDEDSAKIAHERLRNLATDVRLTAMWLEAEFGRKS